MLKAVLFDMDQTLVDWDEAEPWETHVGQRIERVYDYVRRHLHPLDGVDCQTFFNAFALHLQEAWAEGNRTLRAPSVINAMAATLRFLGVPDERLDMDAIMNVYDWQCIAGERVFPDVTDVLRELRRHHVALGIVTNSAQPMIWRDRELQTLDLLHWFPTCRLSAVDVGYLKPHRAIFERALELVGVAPEEAVFVGDSLHTDIEGAQGVGMRAVLRVRLNNPEPEDAAVVPDGVIVTLHDLLPLLDNWYPGWRNGAGV